MESELEISTNYGLFGLLKIEFGLYCFLCKEYIFFINKMVPFSLV